MFESGKKKGNEYLPAYKKVGATLRNCFLFGPRRPTGLCHVVDNSTSPSPEGVFRSCGKVRREELSLNWGRRDEIGGRVSLVLDIRAA